MIIATFISTIAGVYTALRVYLASGEKSTRPMVIGSFSYENQAALQSSIQH
jgi:hypothetical protein